MNLNNNHYYALDQFECNWMCRKLNNISKNIISKFKADYLYEELVKWSKEYDNSFYELISNNKEYTINILNIEREQKKPRKDYENYSSIKGLIWYMYDELFFNEERTYHFDKINDKDEIKLILNTYFNEYYNESDDKETWFNKIKELCDKLGYASNMKEYKENPDNFKGSVADLTTAIRVAITTSNMTPDLYEILKLIGSIRIQKRIDII